MMQKMVKNLRGITLIEVVLYLALFGMFFLVMVQFFFFIGDSNQLSGESMKIDRTMIYLSQHFEDTFKRGVAINPEEEGGSVFGVGTGVKLSMAIDPLPENQLDPTVTPTPVPTNTPVPTLTPSLTPTATIPPTATAVPTATFTPTPIPTATFTPTPTYTPSPTPTNTPTLTPTFTPTATFTPTPTNAPTPTIMFVGANADKTTTVAMPPYIQSGDLMIMAAYRRNSTMPSEASGWTTLGTHSGNSSTIRLAYKLAESGSETSGSWGNAQFLAVQVFRNHGGVGNWAINSANNVNINYPSLTLINDDGNSWLAAFGGHDAASNVEQEPTGMFNVTSAQSTGELAGHNTNGGVSSWPDSIIVNVNANDSWKAAVVEIKPYTGVLGAYDENLSTDFMSGNKDTSARVLGAGTEEISYTLNEGILYYNEEPITRGDLNVTSFGLTGIKDKEDNLVGVRVTIGIESRVDPNIKKQLSNNYLLKQ